MVERHYISEGQHLEATQQCVQLVSDCMAAIAAGGSLRSLELSVENLELDCAPWAGLMSQLQRLHIGCSGGELKLGSWMGGMQALKQLSVAASSLSITSALPPSLTGLVLHGRETDGLLDGLSDLPALADLSLVDCHESLWWKPLAGAGSTLRRLHVRRAQYPEHMQPLAALTALTSLELEHAPLGEWPASILADALRQMRQLQRVSMWHVSLSSAGAAALAGLPLLERLLLLPPVPGEDDGFDFHDEGSDPVALPPGACSSSLRCLAVQWPTAQLSLPLLRAASRLQQLHIVPTPNCSGGGSGVKARELAGWAAEHPSLQQVCLEMQDAEAVCAPVLDAALLVQRRRPQLLVQRTQPGHAQQAVTG